MNSSANKVIVVIAKCLLYAVRFVLFILLLCLGRLLRPIAHLVICTGSFLFVFCLCLRPDMTLPMWAGAGFAVAGTALLFMYDVLLICLAPDGVEIFTEI